jgi:hypothetical protein
VSPNTGGNIFPPNVALDSVQTIDVSFTDGNNGVTVLSKPNPIPDSDQITAPEFWAELETNYGLALPQSWDGVGAGQAFYSMNGVPTTNSPISLVNGFPVINLPGVVNDTIVLQHSKNGSNWTSISTNAVPRGATMQQTIYELPDDGTGTPTLYRTVKLVPQ